MFTNTIGNKMTQTQQDIATIIYLKNIHVAITRKALYSLASPSKTKKGKDIPPNLHALEMLNGKHVATYEELLMDTMTALCNAIKYDLVTLDSDYTIDYLLTHDLKDIDVQLVFTDADENGKSETFRAIFRTVANVLYKQKRDSGNSQKWLQYDIADYEHGDTKGDYISIKSQAYRVELAKTCDELENMTILHDLKKALKQSDIEILTHLLNGLTYQQIADAQNITKRAVQCAIDRIRKAYPTTELKQPKQPKAKWQDTTTYKYLVFNGTRPALPQHLENIYSQYVSLHNDFITTCHN